MAGSVYVGTIVLVAVVVAHATTSSAPRSPSTSGPQCGQQNIGHASDVRNNLDTAPIFQTGGGDCGFWLALDNGYIVAYKAVQPSGCTLQLKLDHWRCGTQTIAVADLAKYPISIQTVNGVDDVIVDLQTR